MYMFLSKYVFLFLLGLYLGVKLLDHIVTSYLPFWGTARLFTKPAIPFYFPTNNVWRFQFLRILTNTRYYVFFITAILVGVKWYLFAVSHSN